MPLTLEEIDVIIAQLQEDLRRAKKARTLILKRSKQDARLAEDLDKLLSRITTDPKETTTQAVVEPKRTSDIFESSDLFQSYIVEMDEEDLEESVELIVEPQTATVTVNNTPQEDKKEQPMSPVGALTEEELEEDLSKFF